MTRKFSTRLLGARPTIVMVGMALVALVVAACGSVATPAQPAAAQRPASSAPAHSALATQGSASAGTADRRSTRYGLAPDPALPAQCLMSEPEVTALFHVSGLTYMVKKQYKLCQFRNDAARNFGVVTSVATDFGASGLPSVDIPQGAPFDTAYVWAESDGSVQAVAHLTGQHSQWVILAVANPYMDNLALLKAVKAGIQNIMYWWSKAHSPAPASPQPQVSAMGSAGLVKDAFGYNPPLYANCTITHYDSTNGASFTVKFTNHSARRAGVITVTVTFQPSGVTYLERLPEALYPDGNWEQATLYVSPGTSGLLRGGDSDYAATSSTAPTGCRVVVYDAS